MEYIYFYYSPSQRDLIYSQLQRDAIYSQLQRDAIYSQLQRDAIILCTPQDDKTEVFDGEKFVEYTECSYDPSNFSDARIVAKFAKGEKYQIKYNGILSNHIVE